MNTAKRRKQDKNAKRIRERNSREW